jgi:hypothetical protein
VKCQCLDRVVGDVSCTIVIETKTKQIEILAKAGPSVRVPRAKTRLTVYRSPLVDFLLVERACIKLDVFFKSSKMFDK